MHIGIVGGGFVGSATALLRCPSVQVTVYDLDPLRCNPLGTVVTDLLACDLVFVCVPTPTYADGSCNTTIVRRCIQSLKAVGIHNIILRSTVPPGTSESLDVGFMPEFLTEANWRTDFVNCKQWVVAPRNEEEGATFQRLFDLAYGDGAIIYNTILVVGRKEAEMIKYTRNNFLALKISYFNEIHQLCQTLGIDYDAVRAGVVADSRIGPSHTAVPGFDGHRGFGGTCLAKDTNALLQVMVGADMESHIVRAMVTRNTTVDRPERDWESDPRAFTVDRK
jgi:UDPglucose 6-dehydrogenase